MGGRNKMVFGLSAHIGDSCRSVNSSGFGVEMGKWAEGYSCDS